MSEEFQISALGERTKLLAMMAATIAGGALADPECHWWAQASGVRPELADAAVELARRILARCREL